MPEIVIESVIREGFENARNNPEVIDDVFGELTRAYAASKYGEAELDAIKKLTQEREVSITHAFNLTNTKMPSISIQLGEDTEDTQRSQLGDFAELQDRLLSDPNDLANLIVIPSFTPDSYDSNSGRIAVPDSVDLSAIYKNLLFVDAVGAEHVIQGGVDNTLGNRGFFIPAQATVSIGAGSEVKSSINFNRFKVKSNRENTTLVIGIHAQNSLYTKYLYILVKYFVLSRKEDLCNRGIELSTYSGSDFNRNQAYGGDVVYSRYFTLKGHVRHSWDDSKVALIDNVSVIVKVDKDELSDSELERGEPTVQQTDD